MRDKEEFIKGILDVAKKNLEKDGHLLHMLFLDTDKGMIVAGMVGISNKNNMRDALAHIGKQFYKNGTKINIVFLLSDATKRKFPMEMRDQILEGKVSMESAMETTDSIIIAEWDLTNDYQAVTTQQYHKDHGRIIFDGEPEKAEKAVINMLDSFVRNYKVLKMK